MSENVVRPAVESWASNATKEVENTFALQRGGGGGNNGGMDRIDLLEKRLDKFEGKFDGLQKDVVELRVAVATLTERVAHLPSKGFIVASTVSTLAFLTAVMLFREKIIALFG